MKSISQEYLNSAAKLKGRVDELKQLLGSKKFGDQKKIEDRIVLLNAEYYRLLHTANYLENYYNKGIGVSRQEVLCH